MRIFDRYILREFIKPIFGSVILIVGILLVSRVMDDMGWTLSKGQPLEFAVFYWLNHVPEYIAWVLPMGMLFATSYTIGSFNKNNELTALMVGGVSFLRIASPMIIFGFIVSIFSFFLNDTVVVQGNKNRDFYSCYINKWPDLAWCNAEFAKSSDRFNLKIRSPKSSNEIYFVSASKLIYSQKELIKVNVLKQKDQFLTEHIIAEKARFEDNKWFFFDGIKINIDKNGRLIEQIEFTREFFPIYLPFKRLLIKPRQINIKIVRGNSMTMKETRDYVKELKDAGKPYLFEIVEYYSKLSVPLMAFILTLIGAATGSRMKKAVLVLAFAQSLLIAFFYILLLQLGRVLGREGIIPPLLAAWLGNIIFTFVGLYLFKKSNF